MGFEKFLIDQNKPVHVSWWAIQFGVSEEALLAAIAAVGNRAEDIQHYLNEKKRSATESASFNSQVTDLT